MCAGSLNGPVGLRTECGAEHCPGSWPSLNIHFPNIEGRKTHPPSQKLPNVGKVIRQSLPMRQPPTYDLSMQKVGMFPCPVHPHFFGGRGRDPIIWFPAKSRVRLEDGGLPSNQNGYSKCTVHVNGDLTSALVQIVRQYCTACTRVGSKHRRNLKLKGLTSVRTLTCSTCAVQLAYRNLCKTTLLRYLKCTVPHLSLHRPLNLIYCELLGRPSLRAVALHPGLVHQVYSTCKRSLRCLLSSNCTSVRRDLNMCSLQTPATHTT